MRAGLRGLATAGVERLQDADLQTTTSLLRSSVYTLAIFPMLSRISDALAHGVNHDRATLWLSLCNCYGIVVAERRGCGITPGAGERQLDQAWERRQTISPKLRRSAVVWRYGFSRSTEPR